MAYRGLANSAIEKRDAAASEDPYAYYKKPNIYGE